MVDPGVTAEVAIRLALVLENNATNEMDKDSGRQIIPQQLMSLSKLQQLPDTLSTGAKRC